jgi:sugar lactone lactonase YvrE
MRRLIFSILALALLLAPTGASSHPGSGIVVDRHGNVYFIDTGAGVWKIDRAGKVTKLQGPAFHWLAIDEDGRLAKATLPYFASDQATVTRVGTNPTILVSSDFALTVGSDGTLFYPWHGGHQDGGPWQIYALSPSDTTVVVKSLPANTDGEPLRWINGITTGPDGSVYYTQDRAIRRITKGGEISTVAGVLTISPCEPVPDIGSELRPYYRGLAVDSTGAVFVAAAGCGSVLRIAPDKKVTTVLRAVSPWSPTAVAVAGGDVYVLEYFHTVNENRQEWVPRVKKVFADGHVETIATIERK